MKNRKITATTARGAPIVTVFINDEETVEDMLKILIGQMDQNSSRRAFRDKWINDGCVVKFGEDRDLTRGTAPKFRISNVDPWKIYEDTGDVKKDRLVMYATPSGAMMEGPGLGKDTAQLYELVPSDLIETVLAYWKEV